MADKPTVVVDTAENTLTITVSLSGRLAEIIATETAKLNASAVAREYGVTFDAGNVVQKALAMLDSGPVHVVEQAPISQQAPQAHGLPSPKSRSTAKPLPSVKEADPTSDLLPNGLIHPFAAAPVKKTDGKVMLDSTGVAEGEAPKKVYQEVVTDDPLYIHLGLPLDFTPWTQPIPQGLHEAFAYYTALNEGYPPGFGWLPYRIRMSLEDTLQIGLFVGFWANRLADQRPNGVEIKPFEGFNRLPLGGAKPGSGKGVAHIFYLEGDFE